MAEQTAPKAGIFDHSPVLLVMVAITLFGSFASLIFMGFSNSHLGVYEALFMGMDILKIAGVGLMLFRSPKGWLTYSIGETIRCALIPLVLASQNAHADFALESPLASKGSLILFFSVIFGLIWIMGYGYLTKESSQVSPSEKQ